MDTPGRQEIIQSGKPGSLRRCGSFKTRSDSRTHAATAAATEVGFCCFSLDAPEERTQLSKALSLPSVDNTTDFRGSDFHCGNLPLLEFSLQLIISSSRTGRRPTKGVAALWFW
ncbi:hypothetical protein U1Q18_005781 [Sarracenia purpurea var. burkii]